MSNRIAWSVLLVLAGVAAGALVSRAPELLGDAARTPVPSPSPQASAPAHPDWVAAGPGRIEPISGEIRISAAAAGRLDAVYARSHDKVAKGTLLAIIDDSEQLARVKAAEADVSFREAERDAAISASVPNERRAAEDSLAAAGKDMRRAQVNLDQMAAENAADTAIAALQGDCDAIADYESERDRECTRYLGEWPAYYMAEARWSDSPFWSRRANAAHGHARLALSLPGRSEDSGRLAAHASHASHGP